MYNETNAYISGKSKYNPKLANELKKFNKQRLNIYNKAIDTWFYKMSKKQRAKWGSTIASGGKDGRSYALMSSYVSNCLYKKNKLEFDPYYTCGGNDGSVTLDDYGDKYHYSSKTLKLNGYDISKNAPNRIWNNHIEWKRW